LVGKFLQVKNLSISTSPSRKIVFVFHPKFQIAPLTKVAKKNVKRGGPSPYRVLWSRIYQQIVA
jgi:hypothetical protein